MKNEYIDSNKKIGVLISNLGTPDSPSRKDLKKYLNQFLMDKRVIDLPRLLWIPILKIIILNITISLLVILVFISFRTLWLGGSELSEPAVFGSPAYRITHVLCPPALWRPLFSCCIASLRALSLLLP